MIACDKCGREPLGRMTVGDICQRIMVGGGEYDVSWCTGVLRETTRTLLDEAIELLKQYAPPCKCCDGLSSVDELGCVGDDACHGTGFVHPVAMLILKVAKP